MENSTDQCLSTVLTIFCALSGGNLNLAHVFPLSVFCFLFYFVVSTPCVFSFFTSCLGPVSCPCDCLHQPSCVPPVFNCPSLPCVYKSLNLVGSLSLTPRLLCVSSSPSYPSRVSSEWFPRCALCFFSLDFLSSLCQTFIHLKDTFCSNLCILGPPAQQNPDRCKSS